MYCTHSRILPLHHTANAASRSRSRSARAAARASASLCSCVDLPLDAPTMNQFSTRVKRRFPTSCTASTRRDQRPASERRTRNNRQCRQSSEQLPPRARARPSLRVISAIGSLLGLEAAAQRRAATERGQRHLRQKRRVLAIADGGAPWVASSRRKRRDWYGGLGTIMMVPEAHAGEQTIPTQPSSLDVLSPSLLSGCRDPTLALLSSTPPSSSSISF